MKHYRPWFYLVLALALIGLGIAARPLAANPAAPLAPLTARGAVEAAWERANAVGAYTYATDIEQTTWPLPRLENVGLNRTVDHIYIEGTTDAAARVMQLKLWSQGGSTATGEDSLEMRVEQDQAWGRIAGGEWQALDDGAAGLGLFAPGGDPLGYLAAAQDITRLDAQTRAGVTFERYSFRLDGPRFAAHMRDLMEAELTRKGELPPGLSLDMVRAYLDMTGAGELWIDSAGLPLRMITHAKFPPDRLEQVEATITTDFTDWKTDAATGAMPASGLKTALAKVQDPRFGIHLSLLAAVLSGVALLITVRSSQLYAAVVIVVIASMIGTPLLQSQQAYAFTEKQNAARATYEAEQTQRQQNAQLQAELSRKDFDPQRAPLARNAAVQASGMPAIGVTAPMTTPPSACDDLPNDTGVDTDSDGLTDLQELCLGSDPNLPDTDSDGLNDGIEVYELGLEPTLADTDGDGLPDGLEVQGFVDGTGKRWYLNALDVDTNGDEVPDGMECAVNAGALVCPDTDLDEIADVFDFDDDGDGVPDKFDSAPLLAMGEIELEAGRPVVAGLKDQVFEFSLDQLAVDTPVFVDFQLRPVNPDHLWYTLNVLDWPEDRAGQVQRVHETTFGDSGEEADGDLRLIPMLELEIPYHDGQYGYLPVVPDAPAITPSTPITAWLDTAQMDMYGITVRAKDASGEVLLAYAPLSLVQDDAQGRVAFSARMVYRPSVGAPGALQKARLAWLLQARTDTCTTPPEGLSEDEANAWCDGTAHWVETPSRIIHSYYDDWYLTGLSVREDHGLDVAVIFEDPDYAISQPDYDPETYYESNLWQLANGLDQSFIAGRDADASGARDLPLAEIAARFDRDLNAGVTPTETWGLAQGAFQVVTQTFAHQGYFGVIPMTTTKQVLADYFMNGDLAKIQAATLLFVREERFRTAGLEDVGAATQAGIRQGNRLAVALADADFPDIVLTGMSWSPFRFKGAGVWDAYPYDEYINRLSDTVRPWLAADSEFGSDPYVLEGAVLISAAFYLTVLAGINSVVELDGTVKPQAQAATDLDISYGIAGGAATVVIKGFDVVKKIVGMIRDKIVGPKEITLFSENVRVGGHDLLKDLGKQKAGEPGMFTKLWQKCSAFGKGMIVAGIIVGAVVAVGLVGLAIAFYFMGGKQILMEIVQYVIKGVMFALKALAIYTAIKNIVEIAKKIKGAFDAITKAAVIAAVVGLVLTALFSLGLFIFQMVKGGVGFASLEFNQAFADMVATVIVAAIMVAIGFIPIVGPLIVAIIGMIDLVFATICMALGVDDKVANDEGLGWKIMQEWFCPGLTGLLTKLVGFLIYDQTPLVDLDKADRMQLQHLDVGMVDAIKGISVGNRVAMSADVLTTLYRKYPDGIGVSYLWQYTDMYIDDSTFRYAFVPTNTQSLDVARWQMEDEWIPANNDHGAYWDTQRFTTTQPVDNSAPIPLAKAGLNQQPPLYLAESYAINAQECWMLAIMVGPWVIPVPVCYLREKTDAMHIYMGDSFKFDVFPATLDGFYTLADRGQRSYALAWDARFPTLADADGDNLRSAAWGGNDPDDGTHDSDADGLSDWYELQNGLDPMAADGDGDGLEDYWEVFYETDPYLADSDGDGLTDKEELDGWEYVYAFKDEGGVEVPLITLVTSDPNDPDPDGDGISDKLEQVYGFNPNVYSSSAVLGVSSVIDDADGIVAPGATVAYTATVANYLRDRYALGLLEVEFPAAVQNSDIEPRPYTLGPSQTTTLNGQVMLRPDIDHSYAISLTNRAGANIANLRGEAAGRVLWLHLDEISGTTTFADASLNGNDGACITCPVAGQAGYAGLAAHFDGVDDFISADSVTADGITPTLSFGAWVYAESGASGREAVLAFQTSAGEVRAALYYNPTTQKFEYDDGATYRASAATFAPNGWHHVMATLNVSNTGVLYVDGRPEVTFTSAARPEAGGKFSIGQASGAWFKGFIDEVEIFPRALSAEEISRYVTAPALHAKFDAAAPWSDSSANQIPITCGGSGCPTTGVSAPVGQGVAFNQTQWLSTGGSSALDLSKGAGRFSLAAWIKPESYTVYVSDAQKNDPVWEGWYGILGREDGVQGYPTLYIDPTATRIGLRFGDGATACGYQTVNPVTTPNAWQHVGVTFDGELMTFYINGVAVDTSAACNGKKPYAATWLYAGRPNANGYVWFDRLWAGVINGWESHPEAVLDWNSSTLWRDTLSVSGNPGQTREIHIPVLFGDDARLLWLCEKDFSTNNGNACGTSGGIDNDDTLIYELRNNVTPGSTSRYFDQVSAGAFAGELFWAQDNDFYKGALDDLRIYPYALTAVQMDDLYTGMQRLLELRFDEAPGRTIFADDSGNNSVGVCAGATCPDSGLPGRANQAARFDGVDDFVDLGGGPVVVGSDPFAVSAWIKTQAAQEQVILQQRNAAGGYQLRVTADGNVGWWTSGAGLPGVVVTSTADLTCTNPLVNDALWHHLVATRERDGSGRIYIDGALCGSGAGTVRALTAGAVVVGADTTGNTGYFTGLIDHVLVINKAPTAAEVLALLREAPAIALRLDEPLFEAATGVTTTVFANAANPSVNAGCVLNPTAQQCGCPKAGLDGWMRGAIVFDSMNYASDAPQCLELDSASTPDSFTVGGWFKPTRQRWVGDQLLIGKAGSFELTILRGSMHVKFDVTQDTLAPQAINSIVTTATLMLNQWNHVAATYGDGKLTLYLNGQKAAEGDLPSRKSNANPIHIGNQFVGLADEVFMTDMALDGRAITDMYQYQVAWYDAAFSHDITIDADAPTVAIDHPAAFIPLQPGYVMAAVARDATSAIVSVDYSVNGGATWLAATRDEEVWLFAITPTVEGPLTVSVRATDSVGHSAQNSLTVTADGSAPQVSMVVSPDAQGVVDSLHLTGVATDTLSGVSAVYVTLFDALNAPVGEAQLAQLTSLSGPGHTVVAWAVDYPFPFPPNGSYTVQLSAVDAVNNATVRTPLQRPSAGLRRPQVVSATQFVIEVDGTAPFADVAVTGPSAYVITGTAPLPTLTGAVVEAPYPTGQMLYLHLEESGDRFYDASRTRLDGVCSGAACPASVTGYYGQAASFDGGDALTLPAGTRLGDLTQNLTVMAWVKPTGVAGVQDIIAAETTASANGFGFSLNGAGLRFAAYGAATLDATSIALSAGQWTHVAAAVETGSGMTVTFYVNGVARDVLTATATLAANPDDALHIGDNLNGLLDEIVIYDRALTSAQVQAIANPGESGVTAVEIGFLHAQDRNTSGSLSWQPVALAQPGAAFSTWSATLPAGLEGPHQIYLRTTDGLGHTRVISNVWQGEIDTQAPRVTLMHFAPRFPGDRDLYCCTSEDYNLSATNYECPVTPSQVSYQDAAWYTDLFPQTKLWRYTSPVVAIDAADAADSLTACDLFGACTTVTRTTQSLAWTLGVAIFTPTHTSIFTSHAPIEIGGAAYAQASLNDISLTANGQVIYTHNWGGSGTTLPWTTTFTPNTDGAYTLLATIHDTAANVITSSAPLNGTPGPVTTFYVDATPPEITLVTQRVTQANFANGYIHVTGLVNESVGIASLEISLNNGDWQPVQHTFQPGWQPWSADLYSGALLPPAGESYTLTARVTDMVGHVAEATRVVWADATPPTAFAATLSTVDRQGVRQTLMPGDVIADVLAPQLTMEWTAASDGSGLAPYQVRWIEYLPNGTEQDARMVEVVAPRSDRLTAGEAQKLAVEVTARDGYGNATVVTVGPVYVDYRLTPVYVGALPPTYPGWQQTVCNAIGEDGRVAEHALPGAALNEAQSLYAAWDADGLRLAWTGANWTLHGDLFIYLDTQSGGSNAAYDPYSTLSDTVTLDMAADYVVWVQDSSAATLRRWNGSQWVSAAGLSYAFAASVTDLFIPFSALGIANPDAAALSLVAFAVEEDALKVWAAMPSANPVNSDLASGTGWEPGVLALTEQYTWAALSDGICPAGGVALQAAFTGTPTDGDTPLSVTFTDMSSGGATGWQWAFGDGGTSATQHPTHEYSAAGSYTVTLTASGPGGSDTLTRTDYISVSAPLVAPVADFTAAPLTGQPPLTVVFTDTSTGAITGWQWAFGDGGNSTQQNPTHEYNAAGTYTVTLTVSGPGGSDTLTQTDYILVSESAVIANFSAAPTQGTAPLTVTFTDQSVGTLTGWQWAFGDGGTSAEQHPTHEYTAPGAYTVTLTVSGTGGSDTLTRTDYISVSAPLVAPVADFIAAPLAGQPPLTVVFTDTSTGAITGWQWAFGDGGNSTQQNPTHEYNAAGTYTVTLTVSGPGGSDTLTRTDYISVSAPLVAPMADFTAAPLTGQPPLTVVFTDTSTGDLTGWQWAFGDGGTSATQHPTHEYSAAGSYTVTLTVSGPGGNNTLTRTDYISVSAPLVAPVADFTAAPLTGQPPLTVVFTDTSTGAITGWQWAFGDGGNSTQQNPTHEYNAAGTYTVTLTVSGPGGSDTEMKSNYIVITAAGNQFHIYLPLVLRNTAAASRR